MGVARRRRPNRVHHRRGLRQLSRLATTSTMASQKQETFEGIDFDEIKDVTSLETDEIKVLKICFNMFDVKNVGFLSADDLDDILRGMGFRPSKESSATSSRRSTRT